MSDLVVAVTLGQRDLQVLGVSNGKLFSISPESKHVRAFHQWLIDRENAYDMVGSDDLRSDIQEQHRFLVSAAGVVLPQTGSLLFAKNSDIGRAKADDEKLLVYPRLLARPLLALKEELSRGRVALRRLTILYTHRADDNRWAAGEPIAADVFRRWLRRWLPDVPPEVVVPPVAFLQGKEELYLRDQAGNEHLLPQAAHRIDQAIKDSASCVAESRQPVIRLHDSGGIPQASPVLQASARLHFGNRVQYQAPTEEAGSSADSVQSLISFPAVAVLEARRKASELVQRGEFGAASELAREFPMDGPSWAWNRAVAAAARYFQGYLEDADKQAQSLDQGPARQALLSILDSLRPMSLHVALRAEAALRAQDALNAASLIVTFLDVAEYDAINQSLSNDPHVPCMDRASRQIDSSLFKPTNDDLRQAVETVCKTVKWIRSPRPRDLDAWLAADLFRIIYPWQELAIFHLMKTIGQREDLSQSLCELIDALHRESNTRRIPADFRNIKDHSVLTDDEIRTMTALFDSRLLWRNRRGEPRSCLHTETRPAAVLAVVGVADAHAMYGDLVEGLVSELHACPLV